jgi:NYN domain/OST-HTH/LOTUS domain
VTTTPENTRLAVLIDADNTSPKQVGMLLEEVARYGVPTVKRAYGDWTTQQLSGWKDELNRHAIQPVQQFGYTTGKNSTDSALIIDAMDLLYTGNLEAFALVSSDSDFTRLVTRLRESGKTVYGFGRRRTPASLVAACDKFVFLEVLGRAGEPAAAPEADAAPQPELRRLLTLAIEEKSGDDGWANLGAVGQYLQALDTSFDPRNYGFGKLVALVRAQDYVEVKQGSGTPRVRLHEASPTKKTAVKRTTRSRTTKRQSG